MNPAPESAGPTRTARIRRLRAYPSGWGYRERSRSGRGSPYESMTAAGAPNLIVARKGLEKNGALTANLNRDIDRAYHSSLAWISQRLPRYVNGADLRIDGGATDCV